MEHPLARERHDRHNDDAAHLAVNLLAFSAAGLYDDAETAARDADPDTLGRVIVIWYQMCEAALGDQYTAEATRKVAQELYRLLNVERTPEVSEEDYKHRSLTLTLSRALMLDLATGQMERFVELWGIVIKDYDEDARLGITALFAGLTRGILDAVTSGEV